MYTTKTHTKLFLFTKKKPISVVRTCVRTFVMLRNLGTVAGDHVVVDELLLVVVVVVVAVGAVVVADMLANVLHLYFRVMYSSFTARDEVGVGLIAPFKFASNFAFASVLPLSKQKTKNKKTHTQKHKKHKKSS